MTKAAAIQAFFASFLPAYPAESVPTGADRPPYPYITYSLSIGDFDSKTSITANLWYRGESWVEANAMADRLSRAIGLGGRMLRVDGGLLWLTRGAPFAQSMGDDADDAVKRKLIAIDLECFTQD